MSRLSLKQAHNRESTLRTHFYWYQEGLNDSKVRHVDALGGVTDRLGIEPTLEDYLEVSFPIIVILEVDIIPKYPLHARHVMLLRPARWCRGSQLNSTTAEVPRSFPGSSLTNVAQITKSTRYNVHVRYHALHLCAAGYCSSIA